MPGCDERVDVLRAGVMFLAIALVKVTAFPTIAN